MRTHATALLLGLAALAAAAPAQALRATSTPLGAEPSAPPAPSDTMSEAIPPAEADRATLTVDNPRGDAVRVVAESGVTDVTLGEVPAHGRATFAIPAWMTGPESEVRLFVDPRRGFELSSGVLDVAPDEHLGLRVPPR